MSKKAKLEFQSTEMMLSYEAQLSEEDAVKALRYPRIEGLAPSSEFIELCAPLRSQVQIVEDARRDAPKFKEQAEVQINADRAARVSTDLGKVEPDYKERVSRFLGSPTHKSKSRGR